VIFLDHAATTPVRREALEAMWPFLTNAFGNPSSHHGLGDEAARALAAARAEVAAVIGCRPGDVVFASGGTEADNLAIKGIALANPRGRHIVVTPIEHEAVLESADHLARVHGFHVTFVDVDEHGLVHPEALPPRIRGGPPPRSAPGSSPSSGGRTSASPRSSTACSASTRPSSPRLTRSASSPSPSRSSFSTRSRSGACA